MSGEIFSPIKGGINRLKKDEIKKLSESIKQYLGQCCIENPDISLVEALESIQSPETYTIFIKKINAPIPHKTEVLEKTIETLYTNVNPLTPLIQVLPSRYLRK